MIEKKTDLFNMLCSNIGQPITEKMVNDIMYFIIKTDMNHSDQIGKCMDNVHKLMGLVSE